MVANQAYIACQQAIQLVPNATIHSQMCCAEVWRVPHSRNDAIENICGCGPKGPLNTKPVLRGDPYRQLSQQEEH